MAENGTADGARGVHTVCRSLARAGLVAGFAGLAWLGMAAVADASQDPPVVEPPAAADEQSAPFPIPAPPAAAETTVAEMTFADAAGFGPAGVHVVARPWRPAEFLDGIGTVVDGIAVVAANTDPEQPTAEPLLSDDAADAFVHTVTTAPDDAPAVRPAATPTETAAESTAGTAVEVTAVADPSAATAATAASAMEPAPSVRRATIAPRHQRTPATDPVAHQPTADAETASTHPATMPRTAPSDPATAVVPTGGGSGTASSGSASPTPGVTTATGHLCLAMARCERSTLDDHDAAVWRSERASTSPD